MHLIRPTRLRLEVSSACQLRCPSCPTTTGAARAAVGWGLLRFADFRRLLVANPHLRAIELSNYGEPFLNPDLPAMLEEAHGRGVALRCDNGTNLDRATPAALEAVVRFSLRGLTVSIDGVTQETYGRYRVGGDLERVLGNVATLQRLKREFAVREPALTWQFVVFRWNAHEVEAARARAGELGMRFRPKLSWDEHADPEASRSLFGAASRDDYRERHGVDFGERFCLQLWREPQVNWDGRVLGCCRNFWGDFGAGAFEDLDAALHSERLVHARRMLTGQAEPRADVPCSSCDVYAARLTARRFVTADEIAAAPPDRAARHPREALGAQP